ncbi:MAG TPA: hypothetical protein DIS66_04520 [Candidatus Omnitrophica bacterium]|nr:hypothetical protein [Candidatus Omnitrophota bacterium]
MIRICTFIFLAMLILAGILSAQMTDDSQPAEMNAVDYVLSLHRDADQVQEWTDEAGKNQESAKFSELNRRFSELKGLLSVLDQMLEAGPENYDETTFASANERFNRTFREAEEIEKLPEAAIAQMKKVDDDALLNQSIEDAKGIYTSDGLSYDQFSDSDAARQNVW